MELRQLRYFLAVIQRGTEAAAARANFVTQPAVSVQDVGRVRPYHCCEVCSRKSLAQRANERCGKNDVTDAVGTDYEDALMIRHGPSIGRLLLLGWVFFENSHHRLGDRFFSLL